MQLSPTSSQLLQASPCLIFLCLITRFQLHHGAVHVTRSSCGFHLLSLFNEPYLSHSVKWGLFKILETTLVGGFRKLEFKAVQCDWTHVVFRSSVHFCRHLKLSTGKCPKAGFSTLCMLIKWENRKHHLRCNLQRCAYISSKCVNCIITRSFVDLHKRDGFTLFV